MSGPLKKEDTLMQIREKLRTDNIKLWLPPYFSENNVPSHEDVLRLANDYALVLDLPLDDTYNALLELQVHAVENLKQRNRFRESGLATLKIKVLNQNSPPRIITKELMLTMRVADLKELLTKELSFAGDRLKLISTGKVLNDTESLTSQGVKNGQQILALTLVDSPVSLNEAENQYKELEGVKTDSRLLALDNQYMQLEDQFGNPIKIPAQEKKALIVAMALHEKGNAALKRNDHSRALVFFLEADEEYKHCNCQLLNSVDNYALLDLDITWCYLCLSSVSNLPEASERLKRCEERLLKTYGTNFERLIAVKGTPGNEQVLFLRLHLLQAVVLYHQNKRTEAYQLLKKTEQEFQGLKVDENSILRLVELGYSPAEARLGLRARNGNIEYAANYINENRQKRKESRNKALAEQILERERKKLGKCADGKQYVEPKYHKMLVNMGYNKEAARIALQKCNNIISDSVQYIQENPTPGPSGTKSQELISLVNDLVPMLVDAGFDADMAKLALHKHAADIMKAAEDLLANNGSIDYDPSLLQFLDKGAAPKPSTSKGNNTNDMEAKDEAFKRLAQDISMADDDHLDFTLEQEEEFLNRYLSLFGHNV